MNQAADKKVTEMVAPSRSRGDFADSLIADYVDETDDIENEDGVDSSRTTRVVYETDEVTGYLDRVEGYYLVSKKTGNRYPMLEGVTIKGTASSDIIFCMVSNEQGYLGLLDYFFGASFVGQATDYFDWLAEDIVEYEAGRKQLLVGSLD